MSRLIDADAMKQHYPIMENDFGMVFNEGLHKKLDLEPTVKAIPIDRVVQIKNRLEKMPFYFGTTFHGQTIKTVDVDKVIKMLDEAIKEQNE